jgi:hypothetical protein
MPSGVDCGAALGSGRVGEGAGVSVGTGVAVGAAVGVCVGSSVGVGSGVAVWVGARVGSAVGVGRGVADGSALPPQAAIPEANAARHIRRTILNAMVLILCTTIVFGDLA